MHGHVGMRAKVIITNSNVNVAQVVPRLPECPVPLGLICHALFVPTLKLFSYDSTVSLHNCIVNACASPQVIEKGCRRARQAVIYPRP
jgi:hypothetical protein